jgi:hypothetical protein
MRLWTVIWKRFGNLYSQICKGLKDIFIVTAFNSFQVQQKILARGDISVEDEIADSVFVQVTSLTYQKKKKKSVPVVLCYWTFFSSTLSMAFIADLTA